MSEFPTPESQLAIFEELSELCDSAYGHYDLWWFIRQAADILKKQTAIRIPTRETERWRAS